MLIWSGHKLGLMGASDTLCASLKRKWCTNILITIRNANYANAVRINRLSSEGARPPDAHTHQSSPHRALSLIHHWNPYARAARGPWALNLAPQAHTAPTDCIFNHLSSPSVHSLDSWETGVATWVRRPRKVFIVIRRILINALHH